MITHGTLQIYMTNLVAPYYEHVGFQEMASDAQLTIYSRSDAMGWACKLLIPDCINNSKAKYAQLMNDPDNSRYASISIFLLSIHPFRNTNAD